MTKSRFAYVKYDALAAESQNNLRQLCIGAEEAIHKHASEQNTPQELEDLYLYVLNTAVEGEYKVEATSALLASIEALKISDKPNALIKLESAYFWTGKFIRLSQLARNA